VWWEKNIGQREDYGSIPTYFNGYYDRESGKYTSPLKVDPYGISQGTATFRIVVGDTGFHQKTYSTFQVEVVSTRQYDVEYSCQQGYDIFPLGDNLESKISTAFSKAGTYIARSNYETNLPADSVVIVTDTGGDELVSYAREHSSIAQHPRIGRLFGIRNVKIIDQNGNPSIDPDITPTTVGVSIQGPGGYSYVLAERLNVLVSDPVQRKKEFNRTTIHELGHQRAGFADHAAGHNGENKGKCVMLFPYNQDILDNPIFCEGHKQWLYNFVWSQFVN